MDDIHNTMNYQMLNQHLIKPTRQLTFLFVTGFALATVGTAVADETEDAVNACLEAARLMQEDNDLDGALEEANWCLTGLKQLSEKRVLTLLPDDVNGFAGGEIENQSMLGMSMIERRYTKGDQSLELTITTSGSAGGLGALAQLGQVFGGAAQGKKVRVQKRTVMMSDAGGDGNLHVTLKSGGMMMVKSSTMTAEQLLEFLKAFPLAEFDDAMKK